MTRLMHFVTMYKKKHYITHTIYEITYLQCTKNDNKVTIYEITYL
jgi:hypothetical protein